tara:strand:+ start:324 stop:581 length:258 start_codon:yes stop_codon:yes gene_type:complete
MKFKLRATSNVKAFYLDKHPTDELGQEIDSNINFKMVFECLDNYGNIYDLIGVGDSLVRERIFEALAEIMNVKYDYIYDQWLGNF